MTTLARSEHALVVCRETIAVHSKSFALASRLLPARSRDDAAVLYTWCRRADDAIDLAPAARQPTELARLRAELDSVYGGQAQSDIVLEAFRGVVEKYRIPHEYPAELIAGMEMDTHGQSYPDMHTLLQYCYRVASTVGLMMSHVIGLTRDQAMYNAAHLGIAMQLTNICRDVLEDWELGRLYLPDELLAQHGAGELRQHLGERMPDSAAPAVSRAIAELLERADTHYRIGDRGLSALPWRAAFAIRSARLVYSRIGGYIQRADCDPRAGRAYVPKWHKLLLVARAGSAALLQLPVRGLGRLTGRTSDHHIPQQKVEFPDDVIRP